jgi:hypothetical protein
MDVRWRGMGGGMILDFGFWMGEEEDGGRVVCCLLSVEEVEGLKV